MMDFNSYRKSLFSDLDNQSLKEAQQTMNQMQIISCTEKSEVDAEIAKAKLENAKLENAKVEAEIKKIEAETKDVKSNKFIKIAGVAVTAIGTIGTGAVVLLLNGMNIEAHRREELKYSNEETERERSLSGKLLDKFIKKY